MSHLLVDQLHFTRSEWLRAIDGLSDEDARRRLIPMNCISWMVGHLAWQENRYWLRFAQEKNIAPHLDEIVGYGRPASTPPLKEMLEAWSAVTAESNLRASSGSRCRRRPYGRLKDASRRVRSLRVGRRSEGRFSSGRNIMVLVSAAVFRAVVGAKMKTAIAPRRAQRAPRGMPGR